MSLLPVLTDAVVLHVVTKGSIGTFRNISQHSGPLQDALKAIQRPSKTSHSTDCPEIGHIS
jgi:hypothetical protein